MAFMRFESREPSILRDRNERSPELQPLEKLFAVNEQTSSLENRNLAFSLDSVSQGLEDSLPSSSSSTESTQNKDGNNDRLQTSNVGTPKTPSRSTKRSNNLKKKKKKTAREHGDLSADGNSSTTSASSSESTAEDLDERSAKNRFLVKNRNDGMSYKEIKELGGFSEAVSTLRGRYRMLTKHASERVRRPEWTDLDVRLSSVLRDCEHLWTLR